jgi:magnesium transporter
VNGVITVYVHENGDTRCVELVDPAWLDPASPVTIWVDIAQPSEQEQRLLGGVFQFHPLSVEDALSAMQYPKIEPYPGYLYLVLHGIDFKKGQTQFATHDVDFFLGRNYLVTVHDGTSRSIAGIKSVCSRHEGVLREGPVGVLHRIVDSMVDNYRPAVEELEDRISQLEEQAFKGEDRMVRRVLRIKRELSSMRRVLMPQRDAIARLARREFAAISDEMAFRFRDVHDQVLRYAEESILFQDRVTGILEVNLSTISNRLNQVMKVLTVMSTIFLPLTVLTGMWGMNIDLPRFPGDDAAQFWWVVGIMAAISAGMLALVHRQNWL